MHRPSALMSSTTMISPIEASLIPDSPYYPSAVPTPPLSASPADLPPIPELSKYERHHTLDDGPPSPASPKKQKDALPAYLEPTPQVYVFNATSKIRPQLFHLLSPPLVSFPTRRATAPALTHPSIYSPLPRRSHSQSVDYIRSSGSPTTTTTTTTSASTSTTTDMGRYPSTPTSSASSSPTTLHQSYHPRSNNNTNRQQQPPPIINNTITMTATKKRKHYNNSRTTPIATQPDSSAPLFSLKTQELCTSPTLAAACASAANLHTSPSSVAASTLSSPSSPTSNGDYIKHDDDKKQVDHSMFLTKNAHIKRPRNAWIHFRCHYGQALKTQDPTLRAEEISKRASRRWSLLSENEKRPWHQLAEQEKQAHKVAFPEYRYCPKRTSTVTATIHPPPSNVAPSPPPHLVHPTTTTTTTTSLQGLYRLPRLSNDMDSSSRLDKKLKKI